jgi:hypothetical protein
MRIILLIQKLKMHGFYSFKKLFFLLFIKAYAKMLGSYENMMKYKLNYNVIRDFTGAPI